jgi:hypothetical protein
VPPKLEPLTVEQRIQMYKTMLDEVRGGILTDAQRQEQEELATKLRGKKKKGVRAGLTDLFLSLRSFFSQPSPKNQLTADTDKPDRHSANAK